MDCLKWGSICGSICVLLLLLSSSYVLIYSSSGGGGGGGGPMPFITTPLPFIVLHGIADACKNNGVLRFTQLLSEATDSVGYCIEIGNGVDDSFFMRLDKQADWVCQRVKNMSALQGGYNMVGLSQGTVIGRAVIEWCENAPPVNNFVSIGGPQAGIAGVPLCKILFLCKVVDSIIRMGVYSAFVQNNLAPSGYIKIPTDLDSYYSSSVFLPKLNNELPHSRNSTYKLRFSSLNHLALIKFERDEVLYPSSTAWFGFFAPNDFDTIQSAEETDLYKEDWIGLKALYDSGRVSYVSLPGGHLVFTERELLQSTLYWTILCLIQWTGASTLIKMSQRVQIILRAILARRQSRFDHVNATKTCATFYGKLDLVKMFGEGTDCSSLCDAIQNMQSITRID